MKFVSLKKKNTSKFQMFAKRLATVSAIGLFMTAVIVVPLTSKPSAVSASNNSNVEIIDEYIGDIDYQVVNSNDVVDNI